MLRASLLFPIHTNLLIPQKYEAQYPRNRVLSLVFRIIRRSQAWPGYASMFFTNCMSITDTWARVAVV